jgi:copper chaperone CopZ
MRDIDDLGVTVDLVLDGMSCPRCAQRVEQALSSVPGVASVEARIGGARVVYYPEVTRLRALRERLDRIGYPVREPAPRGLGRLALIGARRRLGTEALDCCTLHPANRAALHP